MLERCRLLQVGIFIVDDNQIGSLITLTVRTRNLYVCVEERVHLGQIEYLLTLKR